MEGNFCGSADVENPEGKNGEIAAQDVNIGFTSDGDFSTGSWDAE